MKEKLEQLKKSCLVLDIETCASYPDGDKINISTNFEDYVKFAKTKWLGMYSYLEDEYTEVNVVTCDPQVIQQYINKHKVIVSFNGEEFDVPILYNNNLMPEKKRFKQVDCLVTLGAANAYRHDGLPFKNRGILMGYKFKKNSLKVIAETMKLDTQKGDIDYNIFFKNVWTPEETVEIKKYLRSDVQATKEMFDKLWDFWTPFTAYLNEKAIMNLTWIRASIASLTYQAACHTLGIEPTYADKPDDSKEKMGGRVISPKYEEARNVWYVDFASLYPHIFCQFNLFAEVTKDGHYFEQLEPAKIWHGNDLFKVRGYYDITQQHPLALDVAEKLKERIKLKKEDPKNPMVYTLKIFLNSLYGVVRSPVFEALHTENAGWDCCWLGQQIQEYTEKRMLDFGFETIAGDTDSIFVVNNNELSLIDTRNYEEITEKAFVQMCLKTIIDEIHAKVPFPAETFKIDLEYPEPIKYIMWPFSEEPVQGSDGKNLKNDKGRLIKEKRGKKKNYMYIVHDHGELQVKITGLPIIKDNATILGPRILEETLKPLMIERLSAKFSKSEMQGIMNKWLSKPEAVESLAREYKVKPAYTYKLNKDGTPSNNIYAQISRGYFNGQGGVIRLIKNNKVGKAGKTTKYCTYEEVMANKLGMRDLDLTKLKNELGCFVRDE